MNGTLNKPNGLPWDRRGDVVTVAERLSSQALDVKMNDSAPNWAEFVTEISANRPLISFIPRHSRTVGGYTKTESQLVPWWNFRGLLVYDPWPPTTGVITRWENFDSQTYVVTYTARVKTV